MQRYYHRASSLQDLQQLARHRGVDLDAAMREVGLSKNILRRPEERIEFAQLCALLDHCAREWAMPDLPLRLASYQNLDILGPIGLVTRLAHNMREALTAISYNMDINTNAVIVSLTEEDGVASAVFDTLVQPVGVRDFILLSLGLAKNVIEAVSRTPLDLIEVSLRQEAGGLRAAAETAFRCPIRFGADQDALHFETTVLDRRIERSDEAYRAIIERYFAVTRLETSESMTETASVEIARQMEFGNCTLESLALRLRIEPRSLQRQLKQEGTSFRALVDGWRRTRALSLITGTRQPLSQISMALGFSEQSVFSRAFYRWHGQTPLAARQNEAGGIRPSSLDA